jgi:hypothetical protein
MKTNPRMTMASLVALTGGMTSQSAPAQDATKPEDAPKWKQSAGVGLTLTQGNSETVLFTANYDGSKKWGSNEISVGLNGAYGENDDVKNNEYVKAFGQYNWLFGPQQRWYGFGRVEGLYDGIADIDYRVSASTVWI